MGVLAVQVYEGLPLCGQGRDRRHAAVHVGPGPAVHRHHPGHNDLPLAPRLVPPIALRKALLHRRQAYEPGIHDGLGRPGAYQRGVGPATGEQFDGFYHQGLARPGFPSQRRHPRPEHEAEVVDHPQLAHPQLAQHGPTLAISEMELAL